MLEQIHSALHPLRECYWNENTLLRQPSNGNSLFTSFALFRGRSKVRGMSIS